MYGVPYQPCDYYYFIIIMYLKPSSAYIFVVSIFCCCKEKPPPPSPPYTGEQKTQKIYRVKKSACWHRVLCLLELNMFIII